MIVKAIQCPACGDKIYSRCEDDEQSCCCNYATISGGPIKPTLSPLLDGAQIFDLEVPADEEQLYWDWNLKENQYGTISEFLSTHLLVGEVRSDEDSYPPINEVA